MPPTECIYQVKKFGSSVEGKRELGNSRLIWPLISPSQALGLQRVQLCQLRSRNQNSRYIIESAKFEEFILTYETMDADYELDVLLAIKYAKATRLWQNASSISSDTF